MRAFAESDLIPAAQVINGKVEGEPLGPSQVRRRPSSLDAAGPALVAINLANFVARPLPQRQYVLAPILPERGLAMLFAPRGVGKTQIAFNIGWAVACGQPFLRWYAPRPRTVLYLDGEMPQELLQERAQTIGVGTTGQGTAETGGTAWDKWDKWDKVCVKQSLFSHYVVFELFDFVDDLIARHIKPYFVEVKATTAHSREDV